MYAIHVSNNGEEMVPSFLAIQSYGEPFYAFQVLNNRDLCMGHLDFYNCFSKLLLWLFIILTSICLMSWTIIYEAWLIIKSSSSHSGNLASTDALNGTSTCILGT